MPDGLPPIRVRYRRELDDGTRVGLLIEVPARTGNEGFGVLELLDKHYPPTVDPEREKRWRALMARQAAEKRARRQ